MVEPHAAFACWGRILRAAADARAEEKASALALLDAAVAEPRRYGLPDHAPLDMVHPDTLCYHALVLPVDDGHALFIPSARLSLQSLAARAAPWLLEHMYARDCTPDPLTLAELLQPLRVRRPGVDVEQEALEAAFKFIRSARVRLRDPEFAHKCLTNVLLSCRHPTLITRLIGELRNLTPGPADKRAGLALFMARAPIPVEIARKICQTAGTYKQLLRRTPGRGLKKPLEAVEHYAATRAEPNYTGNLIHALQKAFPVEFRADALADKLVSRLAQDNSPETVQLRAWLAKCAVDRFVPYEKDLATDHALVPESYNQQQELLIAVGGRLSHLRASVVDVPQSNVSAEELAEHHPIVLFALN